MDDDILSRLAKFPMGELEQAAAVTIQALRLQNKRLHKEKQDLMAENQFLLAKLDEATAQIEFIPDNDDTDFTPDA